MGKVRRYKVRSFMNRETNHIQEILNMIHEYSIKNTQNTEQAKLVFERICIVVFKPMVKKVNAKQAIIELNVKKLNKKNMKESKENFLRFIYGKI